MPESVVRNDAAANQFELSVDGKLAVLEYRLKPGRIAFIHTEVPEEIEGQGIGGKLARAGLEFAREQGLIVAPLCPFVAEYIQRHPEFLELVSEEYRGRLSQAT